MSDFEHTYSIDHGSTRLPTFPILLPTTWQRAPTQVCVPLIKGLSLPDVPLLAPVHFVGDPNTGTFQRVHIRTERLEALGVSMDDYLGEALRNLRKRRATWREVMPGTVASLDDFLSAERILDATFINEAAQRLGLQAPSLLVGIPQRAHLFATSFEKASGDPNHLHAFTSVISKLFAAAGDNAITPWPIMVSEGRIVSIIEVS